MKPVDPNGITPSSTNLTAGLLSKAWAQACPWASDWTTKHCLSFSGWPPPTPPRYLLITLTAKLTETVDSGDWTIPPCAFTQPTVTGASFEFAGPTTLAPTYFANSFAQLGAAALAADCVAAALPLVCSPNASATIAVATAAAPALRSVRRDPVSPNTLTSSSLSNLRQQWPLRPSTRGRRRVAPCLAAFSARGRPDPVAEHAEALDLELDDVAGTQRSVELQSAAAADGARARDDGAGDPPRRPRSRTGAFELQTLGGAHVGPAPGRCGRGDDNASLRAVGTIVSNPCNMHAQDRATNQGGEFGTQGANYIQINACDANAITCQNH